MIKEGRFREDLFFRINVMPIYIPPLRERKEDVIHLCQFFIGEYNRKYGRNTGLSLEVCNLLEVYDWPGNVRELKSLIERLVIVSEGDKIKPEDFAGRLHEKYQVQSKLSRQYIGSERHDL